MTVARTATVLSHARPAQTADALRALIEAAEREGVVLRFDPEETRKYGLKPRDGFVLEPADVNLLQTATPTFAADPATAAVFTRGGKPYAVGDRLVQKDLARTLELVAADGAGGFAPLRRAMAATARPGAFTAEDAARYRAAWARQGALTAMVNWYRALPASAGSVRAGRVSGRVEVPVRVVWGDRDPYLDRGLAEAGLGLCDRGEAFHLPGATHWVQHDEPERVGRLLAEFLKGAAS